MTHETPKLKSEQVTAHSKTIVYKSDPESKGGTVALSFDTPGEVVRLGSQSEGTYSHVPNIKLQSIMSHSVDPQRSIALVFMEDGSPFALGEGVMIDYTKGEATILPEGDIPNIVLGEPWDFPGVPEGLGVDSVLVPGDKVVSDEFRGQWVEGNNPTFAAASDTHDASRQLLGAPARPMRR